MDPTDIWPLLLARLRRYFGLTYDLAFVANFCGVVPTTMSDWLTDKQPASGERLIRLWYFLRASGMEAPELDDLPAFNTYVAELLAFSVISMDEAKAIFGVKHSQAALLAMRGQPPMHPKLTLSELHELYGENLTEAKALFSQSLPLHEEPERASKKPAEVSVPQVVNSGGSHIVKLATLLGAATPLIRLLDSDRSTAEDRQELRALMGEEGMFELSNHFEALCGERSRNQRRS